jgi:membrane-associated phospholipid phosphatase
MLRDFLGDLPRGFVAAFRGRNLYFHVLAIALTAILVLSGFDWWYFLHTRGSFFLALSLPAALLGFFLPILVPIGLYLWSIQNKSAAVRIAAVVLAQAAILSWFISSLYKSFTGRIQPEFLNASAVTDISRNFHFGFWQHGIFWGWPSSHTAVAFAMSVALIGLFPRRRWVLLAALLYAFFIGLGVSVSIHWFSDFVAGAIIGSIVGLTVANLAKEKTPQKRG